MNINQRRQQAQDDELDREMRFNKLIKANTMPPATDLIKFQCKMIPFIALFFVVFFNIAP